MPTNPPTPRGDPPTLKPCRILFLRALAGLVATSVAAATLALAQSPVPDPATSSAPTEQFIGLRQTTAPIAPQPGGGQKFTSAVATVIAARPAPRVLTLDCTPPDLPEKFTPEPTAAAVGRSADSGDYPRIAPRPMRGNLSHTAPFASAGPDVHSPVKRAAAWTWVEGGPEAVADKPTPAPASAKPTPAPAAKPLAPAAEPVPAPASAVKAPAKPAEPAPMPRVVAAPDYPAHAEQPDRAGAAWYSPTLLCYGLILTTLVLAALVSVLLLCLVARFGKTGGETEATVEAHRMMYALLLDRGAPAAPQGPSFGPGASQRLGMPPARPTMPAAPPRPVDPKTDDADGDMLKLILEDNLNLRDDDAGESGSPGPDEA